MTCFYSPHDLRELLKDRAKDLLTAIERRKPDADIIDACEHISNLGHQLKYMTQTVLPNKDREYWHVA